MSHINTVEDLIRILEKYPAHYQIKKYDGGNSTPLPIRDCRPVMTEEVRDDEIEVSFLCIY